MKGKSGGGNVVVIALVLVGFSLLFIGIGFFGGQFLLKHAGPKEIPTVTTVAPEADAFLKDTSQEQWTTTNGEEVNYTDLRIKPSVNIR